MMEYQNNPDVSHSDADMLSDLSLSLVQASTGKRFLNYIIDIIFFYLIVILIGFLWAMISPDTIGMLADDSVSFNIADRIIALVLYAIILGLLEAIFKGKTLGKLITGTRAVNEDGSTITFGKAMARGFSRAVPFCVFSALGTPSYPWQDKWTDTYVIDEKLSNYKHRY